MEILELPLESQGEDYNVIHKVNECTVKIIKDQLQMVQEVKGEEHKGITQWTRIYKLLEGKCWIVKPRIFNEKLFIKLVLDGDRNVMEVHGQEAETRK